MSTAIDAVKLEAARVAHARLVELSRDAVAAWQTINALADDARVRMNYVFDLRAEAHEAYLELSRSDYAEFFPDAPPVAKAS